MATGLKVVVPSTFSDASLPILRDDARLSAGSLFLADPAHSANPWAAGVPADGYAVPNIAWKESAALLGVGSPTNASLPGVYKMAGISGTGNTKGKVERTPKGALHVIISQAVALAAGDGVAVRLDPTVRAYLVANPGHAYYFAAWYQITRVTAQQTRQLFLFEFGDANVNRTSGVKDSSLVGPQAASTLGSVAPDTSGAQSLGVKRASFGFQNTQYRKVTDGVTNSTTTITSATANFTSADVGKSVIGTGIPASATIASVTNTTTAVLSSAATASASGVTLSIDGPLSALAATAVGGPTIGYPDNGNTINSANVAWDNQFASVAVYSWHLMDLTAAGLTYAQADAIDAAAYTAAFATGGRYNGDSIPTAPSTIP